MAIIRFEEQHREWSLQQGERVRFRCIGEDQEQLGIVRKPMHVLAADQTPVPL